MFLAFFYIGNLAAQGISMTNNIATPETIDSLSINDSANKIPMSERLGIKISADAVDEVIDTYSKDSLIVDVTQSKFYLYGDAKATYKDLEVKAGVIEFDQNTGVVDARAVKDSNGVTLSIQDFRQGEEQFSFDGLSYNFKSQRAIVKNARMQYGEGYIHSEQVKRNEDESIFGYKNLYTTCELDEPHFGIRANKIKAIPGKIVASGPAYLEFEGIKTPLFLPFGLFPVQQKQASGFIMPSYTMEANRGLGLQRGGYYFAINDYIGATLQMDIFSKGSYALAANTQYSNRYRYSGRFQVGYNYTKTGEATDLNAQQYSDFNIQWSHQQDQKARPGTNFNASVNIVSSNYNKLNGMDMNQILNNSFSSSISYSKTWVGRPFTFSAAARHDQNTQSRLVQVTLPEMTFAITQFNPFQFRKDVIAPKWFEKITTSYSASFRNSLSLYDSTFSLSDFKTSDFNNAILHSLNLNAGYTIFRFVNLSFSIPYTEYWNTKQFYTTYNNTTGQTDSVLNNGFYASRQFSFSTSLNTRLYGTKMFKKGKIAGIRHVLTPGIGATYMPGFARAPFEYFAYTQRASASGYYDYVSLYNSPYAPYGGPSNPNPVGSINFDINNNVSIKLRGNDSTESTNINLIDRLAINSSYNFFADSMNLSNIVVSMGSRIKELVTINAGASFDPYHWVNRARTSRYLYNETGRLVDFQNGNVALGFSFRGKKENQEEHDEKVEQNEQMERLMRNGGYGQYYDFNVPYDVNVSYSLNANRIFRKDNTSYIGIIHSIVFGAQMSLTENWRFSAQAGYDLTNNLISQTSINISRDLHCWQMGLNLIPFGAYRSFNFTLNVKSSVLQDLKLIKRRSYLDN